MVREFDHCSAGKVAEDGWESLSFDASGAFDVELVIYLGGGGFDSGGSVPCVAEFFVGFGSAKGARAMAGGEGGVFIQEKQLGPLAPGHDFALPSSKF